MTTSMQGSWTVKVKSKSATWAQRFRIAGSSNGKDGVYAGETATAAVFVTGNPWGITVEHNPTGTSDWRASRQRMAGFRVDGRVKGAVTFGMNAIVLDGAGRTLRAGQTVRASFAV